MNLSDLSPSTSAFRLVLASQSPRRAEILRRLGLKFDVVPAHIDEEAVAAASGNPRSTVMRLAFTKASAVARALSHSPRPDLEGEESEMLVLAADTIVVLEGQILNKPADAREAAHMLAALSGRTHDVMTGLCLRRASKEEAWIHTARTRVTFLPLAPDTIEAYVSTGSPLDKAGAYGIQDHSPSVALVERVEGDYWNVVGLPVGILQSALAHFGALPAVAPVAGAPGGGLSVGVPGALPHLPVPAFVPFIQFVPTT